MTQTGSARLSAASFPVQPAFRYRAVAIGLGFDLIPAIWDNLAGRTPYTIPERSCCHTEWFDLKE